MPAVLPDVTANDPPLPAEPEADQMLPRDAHVNRAPRRPKRFTGSMPGIISGSDPSIEKASNVEVGRPDEQQPNVDAMQNQEQMPGSPRFEYIFFLVYKEKLFTRSGFYKN